METIANILAIFMFLLVIVAFVGLVKPSLVKQESRLKAFGVNIGLAFILFIVIAAIIPEDKTIEIASQKQELQKDPETQPPALPQEQRIAKQEKEKQKEIEFSFTIEELVNRYNLSLQALESDIAVLVKSENDNGKHLTIQLGSNSNIALVVTANNQTRNVDSLVFVGSGEGTIQSGLNIMIGAASVIMAIENPQMPVKQRGEILEGLGLTNDKLSKQGEVTLKRKGVKYTISQSDVIGIMLAAEPI